MSDPDLAQKLVEMVKLFDGGYTFAQAARELGITDSADLNIAAKQWNILQRNKNATRQ